MSKKARLNFVRDDSGAVAVEFAIVSGVFISLLMGVSYLGIMLYTNLSLHWAVDGAIRTVMINPAVTQAAITAQVNGYMTSMGLPTATIAYSVSGAPPTAHISATLARSYTVPLISTFNVNYAADAYVATGP